MNGTMIGGAATLLAAAVIAVWWVRRRSQIGTRRLVKALLAEYFNGDMPADRLGRRSREIAGSHFLASPEFQAMAWAAFQGAADADAAVRPHAKDVPERLVKALGELKTEFGLPDRYRSEGWRAGRE
jgi:hypothetical protein